MITPKYRKSPEILVNYDYTDILNNVGYVVLNGLCDTASDYFLSRLAVASKTYLTTSAPTGSTEKNFDFEFPNSQHIKGNLFITYTMKHVANLIHNSTLAFRIIHYDGTTETEVAAQQSVIITAASGTFYERGTFRFAVDKIFRKGDILRIEAIMSTNSVSPSTDLCGLFHDGENRNFGQVSPAGTATNSNLIIQVPFDLGGKI